jgi:hypothetical protein
MRRPVALFLTVHCTSYGLSTRGAVLFYTLPAVSAGAQIKDFRSLGEHDSRPARKTMLFDPPDRPIPLFLAVR